MDIIHLYLSVMTEFPVEMCIGLYVSKRQIKKKKKKKDKLQIS